MRGRPTPVEARLPAMVAVAAFSFFWPALRNRFMDADDWITLMTNPYYRGLCWTQIKWMFGPSAHTGHYIPLTWLTSGLDYVLWGMNPFGHHFLKTPQRLRLSVISRNHRSTMFAQELKVGMKRRWKRGCRRSQDFTRACLLVA